MDADHGQQGNGNPSDRTVGPTGEQNLRPDDLTEQLRGWAKIAVLFEWQTLTAEDRKPAGECESYRVALEKLSETADVMGRTQVRELTIEVFEEFLRTRDRRLVEIFRSRDAGEKWFPTLSNLEGRLGHQVWNAFVRGDREALDAMRNQVLDSLFNYWQADRAGKPQPEK